MPDKSRNYICQPTTPGWDTKCLARRFGEILFGSYIRVYTLDDIVYHVGDNTLTLDVSPAPTAANGRPEWSFVASKRLSTAACVFLSEEIGPFVSC